MRPESIFALLCALFLSFFTSPGFADDDFFCDASESCPTGGSVLNGVPVDVDLVISNMGTGDVGSDAFYADVAYNATDDEFLVVWRGYSTPTQLTNEGEIYAQRVSAAGVALGDNFQISEVGPTRSIPYSATKPSVAWSAVDNLYLVAWEADAVTDGENEIYGQLLDNLGNQVGPDDFQVSSSGPAGNVLFDAANVDVVYNVTDNEFLVAWEQDILQNEEEIVVRRVDTTGALLGSESSISTTGAPGDTDRDALNPAIAWNSKRNEYLVVWQADAGVTDNELEIWGQRLDADVALINDNFQISTQGSDNDSTIDAEDAAVVFNATANRYLVVWHGDESSAFGAHEVWAQLIRPLGTLEGNAIQVSVTGPVGDTNWDAVTPDVASNHLSDEFMVVWEGDRVAGESEIFGRTLDGSGSLVGGTVQLSTSGIDGDTEAQATDPVVVFNANCDGFLMAWDGDPGTNGRFEIHARLGPCTSCSDGVFGSTCASQCPGGTGILACNANGTCDDGISGSGLCSCSPGFAGASCDSCAENYYGFPPSCNYCLASTTCSGNGICDSVGACDCDQGYSGADCSIPPTATVSITLIGNGNGQVTSSPPGIDCGDDCSEVYTYPTEVTLTAIPSGGSSFSGFGGEAGCDDGTVQIASSGKAVNCTATFEQTCATSALYPIATATGVKPLADALQSCRLFTSSGDSCNVPSRDGFTGTYNAKCTAGSWSITASPTAVECSATGYTGSTLDESCACDTGYVGCGWGFVAWHKPSVVACPVNASGAPACACDSGHRGVLTWETPSWSGKCVQVSEEMFESGFEDQSSR